MKDIYQAEMPFAVGLPTIKFAEASVVAGWACKRDAVMWCWTNRPRRGKNEPQDQSMCATFVGMAASHMSRCLNPRTKAPMDMQSQYVKLFEQYTGWRGVSQFEMRDRGLTIMEEVIAQRAA
jgi:hypothetical protein